MRERVGVRVDLFFMSLKTRKRIKTWEGLFFTSIEMRERVGVRVDLFFMSLKTRERVRPLRFFFSRALKLNSELGPGGPLFQTLSVLFLRDSFF